MRPWFCPVAQDEGFADGYGTILAVSQTTHGLMARAVPHAVTRSTTRDHCADGLAVLFFGVGADGHPSQEQTVKRIGSRTVAALFLGARKANLVRHAQKGTLLRHVARKWWIKRLIRLFPFPGD